MIKITLNGEEKEITPNSSVKDLVETIELKSKMFVVEKNLKIVAKEDYESCIIQDGDAVEIVGFFGGG
ncbi:MAG: sulfur carrier protein ThiS [Candidatus Gastranaerophilales bacterium]|nr:sulfur carrier protein ThiS [Candidatus Gastranaerophilales bacterium]